MVKDCQLEKHQIKSTQTAAVSSDIVFSKLYQFLFQLKVPNKTNFWVVLHVVEELMMNTHSLNAHSEASLFIRSN